MHTYHAYCKGCISVSKNVELGNKIYRFRPTRKKLYFLLSTVQRPFHETLQYSCQTWVSWTATLWHGKLFDKLNILSLIESKK